MPPKESIPAFCQFALAFRFAGRSLPARLWLHVGVVLVLALAAVDVNPVAAVWIATGATRGTKNIRKRSMLFP